MKEAAFHPPAQPGSVTQRYTCWWVTLPGQGSLSQRTPGNPLAQGVSQTLPQGAPVVGGCYRNPRPHPLHPHHVRITGCGGGRPDPADGAGGASAGGWAGGVRWRGRGSRAGSSSRRPAGWLRWPDPGPTTGAHDLLAPRGRVPRPQPRTTLASQAGRNNGYREYEQQWSRGGLTKFQPAASPSERRTDAR